jgi:protein-S-isoprenylcysteine O-methyltransferase Ste14
MPRRILISLLLPSILLIVVPLVVVLAGGSSGIALLSTPLAGGIASVLGGFLIAVGLVLGIATVPLFLRQKRGTVMPWEPAGELIVEGVYRHVRNPMHTGVFCILFGEGLILRSATMLAVATVATFVHLLYIPLSEERDLERRFGEAYRVYIRNVPRWIPRLTAWYPDKD